MLFYLELLLFILLPGVKSNESSKAILVADKILGGIPMYHDPNIQVAGQNFSIEQLMYKAQSLEETQTSEFFKDPIGKIKKWMKWLNVVFGYQKDANVSKGKREQPILTTVPPDVTSTTILPSEIENIPILACMYKLNVYFEKLYKDKGNIDFDLLPVKIFEGEYKFYKCINDTQPSIEFYNCTSNIQKPQQVMEWDNVLNDVIRAKGFDDHWFNYVDCLQAEEQRSNEQRVVHEVLPNPSSLGFRKSANRKNKSGRNGKKEEKKKGSQPGEKKEQDGDDKGDIKSNKIPDSGDKHDKNQFETDSFEGKPAVKKEFAGRKRNTTTRKPGVTEKNSEKSYASKNDQNGNGILHTSKEHGNENFNPTGKLSKFWGSLSSKAKGWIVGIGIPLATSVLAIIGKFLHYFVMSRKRGNDEKLERNEHQFPEISQGVNIMSKNTVVYIVKD